MTRHEEDRQFDLWRRTGDAEALARVFDLTAPRLLLVALHVSRNSARADDLVQITFLEAMRDSSQWDPAKPVYKWLTGILSHRALDEHRRQRLREADPLVPDAWPAPASGEEPGPVQALLDVELAESVATKVDALPAAYREVLILRLVHGLEPVEIAHSLQRAPGTVRMQLKRGLERLRRELPESLALPALFSVDVGRGLAAVKTSVLSGATGAAATAAVGTGSGLTFSFWSFFAMQTKTTWMIASACVALCATVWMTWNPGAVETMPAGPVAAAAPPLSTAPGLEPVDAERDSADTPRASTPATEASARQPVTSVIEPPATSLRVVVRIGSDESPAPGVGVHLGLATRTGPGAELATDAGGAVLFEELEPGAYRVTPDRGAPRSFEVVAGLENELVVVLPAGLRVEGEVLDLEGTPVPGALIYRHQAGHPNFLQQIATADDAGEFAIENVPPRSDFLARAPGYQPSEEESASREQDGVGQLTLVMGALGHRLEGLVLDALGEPAGPVLIAIAVDEDAREKLEGVTMAEVQEHDRASFKPLDRETIFVRADSRGRFSTMEAPAGPAFLMTRGLGPDEALVATALTNVWPGAENRVTLQLAPAAQLTGRITDETGRAFAGVVVQSTWDGSEEFGSLEDDLGPLHGDRETLTDASGSYLLTGLLPGEHDLYVGTARTALVRGELVVEAGEHATWSPVLAPRSDLPVRLEGPDGGALTGWGIRAVPPAAVTRDLDRTLRLTDAEGRCRLPLISYEPQQIWVHAPSDPAGPAGAVEAVPCHVVPGHVAHGALVGGDELVVRLRASELPTAHISARLLGPAGEPARDGYLLLRRTDQPLDHPASQRLRGPSPNGSFTSGALSPGTYELEGAARHNPGAVFGVWILAAGEELDVGELRLPEPTTLVVRLRLEGGGELEDPLLLLRDGVDGDGPMRFLAPSEDGARDEWQRDSLGDGFYQLSVIANNAAPLTRTLELRGGGEHVERFTCVRGHVRELDVSLSLAAQGAQPPGTLRTIEVHVRNAAGQQVWFDREQLETRADARWRLPLRLEAGRYSARVSDHGQRGAEPLLVEFEVGPGAPATPVEVRVP